MTVQNYFSNIDIKIICPQLFVTAINKVVELIRRRIDIWERKKWKLLVIILVLVSAELIDQFNDLSIYDLSSS